jgi:hypothetical protein
MISTLIKILTNLAVQIITHIPCCGPQLLFVTGATVMIGQTGAKILYQSQFILPLLISVFFTWGPMAAWFQKHRHSAACSHGCLHKPLPKWRVYLNDLKIGYAVTLALYLVIPPHNHNLLFGHVEGWAATEKQFALLYKKDAAQYWPWSERFWVNNSAVTIEGDTLQAQMTEVSWYRGFLETALTQNKRRITGTFTPDIDRSQFLRLMWTRQQHPKIVTGRLKAKFS